MLTTLPNLTGNVSYTNSSTSTILNNTINAFSIATSTTATPIFTIDSTIMGRVGIGTTSPWGTFSIETQGTTTPVFVIGDIGTSTPLLIVTGSRNVGIGTTSPVKLLEVTGATTPGGTLRLSSSDTTVLAGESFGEIDFSSADTSTDGVGISGFIKNVAINAGQTSALTFGTRTTGIANAVELMRLNDTGRLGIGTTSPSTLLSVSGSSGLMLTNTGAGNTFYVEDVANDTSPFVINAAGNVGIGTTSPSSLLSVAGTVYFNQGVTLGGIANGAGTAYVCHTLASGVISTSTTACNPSSLRYKENIADIGYGLSDVLKMHPVSYDYKPELLVRGHQVGFTAEEMYGVIPEVVGLDEDGRPDNIDYAKLTSVLARAIQDLNAKMQGLASSTASGSVLTTNAWSVDQVSGKVNVSFFGDINMQGNAILDVGKITGYLGKWSIDSDGTLIAEKVIANEVIAKKLTVEESIKIGSGSRPIGITIYDETTGVPYCIKVKGGVMVSEAGECSIAGNQEALAGQAGSMNQEMTQEVGLPIVGSPTSQPSDTASTEPEFAPALASEPEPEPVPAEITPAPAEPSADDATPDPESAESPQTATSTISAAL